MKQTIYSYKWPTSILVGAPQQRFVPFSRMSAISCSCSWRGLACAGPPLQIFDKPGVDLGLLQATSSTVQAGGCFSVRLDAGTARKTSSNRLAQMWKTRPMQGVREPHNPPNVDLSACVFPRAKPNLIVPSLLPCPLLLEGMKSLSLTQSTVLKWLWRLTPGPSLVVTCNAVKGRLLAAPELCPVRRNSLSTRQR